MTLHIFLMRKEKNVGHPEIIAINIEATFMVGTLKF